LENAEIKETKQTIAKREMKEANKITKTKHPNLSLTPDVQKGKKEVDEKPEPEISEATIIIIEEKVIPDDEIQKTKHPWVETAKIEETKQTIVKKEIRRTDEIAKKKHPNPNANPKNQDEKEKVNNKSKSEECEATIIIKDKEAISGEEIQKTKHSWKEIPEIEKTNQTTMGKRIKKANETTKTIHPKYNPEFEEQIEKEEMNKELETIMILKDKKAMSVGKIQKTKHPWNETLEMDKIKNMIVVYNVKEINEITDKSEINFTDEKRCVTKTGRFLFGKITDLLRFGSSKILSGHVGYIYLTERFPVDCLRIRVEVENMYRTELINKYLRNSQKSDERAIPIY
jgi:hypothetical protein